MPEFILPDAYNFLNFTTSAGDRLKRDDAAGQSRSDQFNSYAELVDHFPLRKLLDDIPNEGHVIERADGFTRSIRELVDQAKKAVDQLLFHDLAVRPRN